MPGFVSLWRHPNCLTLWFAQLLAVLSTWSLSQTLPRSAVVTIWAFPTEARARVVAAARPALVELPAGGRESSRTIDLPATFGDEAALRSGVSAQRPDGQPDRRPTDPRAARFTLLLVAAAVVSSVLASTMTNVALPLIGQSLRIEPARLGWLVTGYLLVFGVATPFYGRLAERWGARRLFVAGLGVFAAGSLLCLLASTYGVLLAARLVQAAGAGAIPGLGIALVSRAYPPARRGGALGIVSAAAGGGAAVGPTLGGFVAGTFGWPAIYAILLLTGLLAPLAWRVLPTAGVRRREPIDVPGGLLLALTVAAALLTATEASRGDWSSLLVRGALVTAALAAVGLVLRQRLAATPFVPRELVRNRRFVGLSALSFVVMSVFLPVLIALPLLLTAVNGLQPVQVGLVLLPEALVFIVLGPVAGRLVDRIGPRRPMLGGLLVMSVAVAALAVWGAGAPAAVISLLAALLSAGFAFVNSPLTTTVSLVVPPERLSSALSLNSMLFSLGGAFGSALLAALLTARSGARSAFNPFYGGAAVAFSDAFTVLLGLLLLAFVLTIGVAAPTSHSRR